MASRYICEHCKKEAYNVGKIMEEQWFEFKGGDNKIMRWMSDGIPEPCPQIGLESRMYYFCSIGCFVKALEHEDSL